MKNSTKQNSSGFSLIEIAIALMVIAVGMLGVLSMFPVGLEQNERSLEETYSAMFAQEVFSGLKAYAESNWANLASFNVPFSLTNTGFRIQCTIANSNDVRFIKYVRSDTNIVDYALRYSLIIQTNGPIKSATLLVYPGEFGQLKNPIVFYNEFFGPR